MLNLTKYKKRYTMSPRCFEGVSMSHIISMPKNLSYYPSTDLKSDGAPVMVLDMSQTHVHMIPESLKGVDRVLVRAGQLMYIASDYEGQVYVQEKFHRKNGEAIYREWSVLQPNINQMKILYRALASTYRHAFDQSYFANLICDTYPPEEINLPASLCFSWNHQQSTGALNARHTWLQKHPEITNVSNVSMPIKARLMWEYKREAMDQKNLSKSNNQSNSLCIYDHSRLIHN